MLPGWPSGRTGNSAKLDGPREQRHLSSSCEVFCDWRVGVKPGIHPLRITLLQLNEGTRPHKLCPFVSEQRLKCACCVLLRAGIASHRVSTVNVEIAQVLVT